MAHALPKDPLPAAILTDRAPAPQTQRRLVSVRDLTVRFETPESSVSVINGVSFDIARGEVLCLLGESGSGKSVTMRALMRLLPPTARIGGAIEIAGTDVLGLDRAGLRRLRGADVAMIFQEPMTALDPVFT